MGHNAVLGHCGRHGSRGCRGVCAGGAATGGLRLGECRGGGGRNSWCEGCGVRGRCVCTNKPPRCVPWAVAVEAAWAAARTSPPLHTSCTALEIALDVATLASLMAWLLELATDTAWPLTAFATLFATDDVSPCLSASGEISAPLPSEMASATA